MEHPYTFELDVRNGKRMAEDAIASQVERVADKVIEAAPAAAEQAAEAATSAKKVAARAQGQTAGVGSAVSKILPVEPAASAATKVADDAKAAWADLTDALATSLGTLCSPPRGRATPARLT